MKFFAPVAYSSSNVLSMSMSNDGQRILVTTNTITNSTLYSTTGPSGLVVATYFNQRASVVSRNAMTIIGGTVGYPGRISYNTDGGTSLTTFNTGNSSVISAVSCDYDGSVLLFGEQNYRLWLSTNYGADWSEKQPAGDTNQNWSMLAMDDLGETIIAGVNNGRLYLSTNSGTNWSEVQPAGNYDMAWKDAKISSNGEIIVVCVNGGRLYMSDDSGSTWNEILPLGDVDVSWSSIDISSSGQQIYVCAGTTDEGILVSYNYGGSWSIWHPTNGMDSNGNYSHIAIPSGQETINKRDFILGVANATLAWVTDPINWTERQPPEIPTRFGIDYTGAKAIVAKYNGRIYTTTDSGQNWTERRPAGDVNGTWENVFMSGDGTYVFAQRVTEATRLYRSGNGGSSWSSIGDASVTDLNVEREGARCIYSNNIQPFWIKRRADYLAGLGSQFYPGGVTETKAWTPLRVGPDGRTCMEYYDISDSSSGIMRSWVWPPASFSEGLVPTAMGTDDEMIISTSTPQIRLSDDKGVTFATEITIVWDSTSRIDAQSLSAGSMSLDGSLLFVGGIRSTYLSNDWGDTWTRTFPKKTPNQGNAKVQISQNNDVFVAEGYIFGVFDTEGIDYTGEEIDLDPYAISDPSSDIAINQWTDQDLGITNLYVSLADDDDATYVISEEAPDGDILEVALASAEFPETYQDHFVEYRFKKNYAGGPQINLEVTLMCGSTEIASWTDTNIGSDWTDQSRELTSPQAASITDYTNLRLRFQATQVT
jgi:photosystem II stability/assembly factor-like uncharacterized protein